MSLHGPPCHFELAGDFGVVTALQKQFNDLLFARTETNSLLLHPILPLDSVISIRLAGRLGVTDSHSILIATLRRCPSATPQDSFPQVLATVFVSSGICKTCYRMPEARHIPSSGRQSCVKTRPDCGLCSLGI